MNAIIVARLNSTRLPGKALMKVCGKPLLQHLTERVKQSDYVNKIILATTTNPEDDALEYFAQSVGISCFRGDADDVLSRVVGAVNSYPSEGYIHLLGDNPLIHSKLIDDVVAYFFENNFNAISTATKEYKYVDETKIFANGIRVQVYTSSAINKCSVLVPDKYNREHATNFIFANPDLFNVGFFGASGYWEFLNKPEINFAVNNKDDFDFITRIFNKCMKQNNDFSLLDMFNYNNQYEF